MSESSELHLQELYKIKLQRLQVLEGQAAQFGSDCPAHIVLEIQSLRHEIEYLQRQTDAANTKQELSVVIISKYREPLLWAAFDLQSRLYNIVQQGFLHVYYHKSVEDQKYVLTHTLFVVAEFFGWVEILRREARFLDLGSVEATRRLEELLFNISQSFLTDAIDLTFRLFRGEQRAIGEIMIQGNQVSAISNLETIGYAAFTTKLETPEFARWFVRLRKDIERLATDASRNDMTRLIYTQHGLVNLIDFLDPNYSRIPKQYRGKISLSN